MMSQSVAMTLGKLVGLFYFDLNTTRASAMSAGPDWILLAVSFFGT